MTIREIAAMPRIIRVRCCQDCPSCQCFGGGYGQDSTVIHWCWNHQHPRSKPGGVLLTIDVTTTIDPDCPLPEKTTL